MKLTESQLSTIVWIIGVVVVVAAVAVWYGQRISSGQLLTGYSFFPLFGLLAFSLMWTHYVGGALRRYFGLEKSVLSRYFKVTAVVVLTCILIHPGILWLQLFQDGFGLPPISHLLVYTDNTARFALLLGTISLIIFLVFELHRLYADRGWWRYINHANVAAMLAIFVHALMLGGELNVAWYQAVWYGYGLTLAAAVIYTLVYDFNKKRGEV